MTPPVESAGEHPAASAGTAATSASPMAVDGITSAPVVSSGSTVSAGECSAIVAAPEAEYSTAAAASDSAQGSAMPPAQKDAGMASIAANVGVAADSATAAGQEALASVTATVSAEASPTADNGDGGAMDVAEEASGHKLEGNEGEEEEERKREVEGEDERKEPLIPVVQYTDEDREPCTHPGCDVWHFPGIWRAVHLRKEHHDDYKCVLVVSCLSALIPVLSAAILRHVSNIQARM